jgi:hypothetical protein
MKHQHVSHMAYGICALGMGLWLLCGIRAAKAYVKAICHALYLGISQVK